MENRDESTAARWFGNAPWWMISAGLHVVLLLGAALIYVERALAVDESPIILKIREGGVVLPPQPPEPPSTSDPQKGAPLTDDPSTMDPNQVILWDPLAEIGKRNETANNDPRGGTLGDSPKFTSFLPGESGSHTGRVKGPAHGSHEIIGAGGGAGSAGKHGDPFGGMRHTRVTGRKSDTKYESVVLEALKWLARHQGADGGWSADFAGRCSGARCSGAGEKDFNAGVTGLSLLAFLGAGYTHFSRDEFPDPADPSRTLRFGETVKKGLQWLMARQDPEGCVGERGQKYMYSHTIATLALCEGYGMTGAQLLKDPAQKAVDFMVSAQNPGRGWRYGARSGDNDTSVTGWAVMALKSAELSEIHFPRSSFDGALAWLNEATEMNGYYRTGYTQAGTGKVYVPGKNEQFSDHPSMSAVALMSRIFIQKRKDDPAHGAAQMLLSDLPEWKAEKVDFYYWYYASLALFQLDGPDGARWKKWNEPLKSALVPHQKGAGDGCRRGSWDPEAERWGFEGGRVYATAINALTLEVYYRYGSVFGGTKK